ncbi:MAG: alpha/beta fold hydrolase [Dehalococcoidia bacterium]|nr:alpha/beta fold hydrolase [Dehalococcoidia bacterium]
MKPIAAEEQRAAVRGVRLWTKRHGDGPPMVLLHGGPGMWDYFDELAAMLDDIVEVHRYDQRGGGRSEDAPPYDVESFVADLEALRCHWRHERWIVCGHSWGANLALAYAVKHPRRVSALLLLSGTGVVDDWREEYHRSADARRTPEQRARRLELRAIVKGGGDRWTPELDREYCLLTWMADYADRDQAMEYTRRLLRPYGPNHELNAALGADLQRLCADGFGERMRRVEAPALVLHGARDPRPVRLAERQASMLPNARLVIVPEAGHLPWVEQAEAFRAAVRSFVAETVAIGASS